MTPAVLALATLAGCTSEAEVAEAMERALLATNDAVAVALVSAEPRSWAHSPASDGLRHATACGCPCRTRVGDPPDFTLFLDYHPEGCIPDSGLLAVGVAGVAEVAVAGDDVTVGFDGAFLTEVALAGTLAGDATAAVGDLRVGDRAFHLDLDVVLGEEVVIDGDVRAGGDVVRLRDVHIARPDLGASCPLPSAGTAVVGEVEVSLGEPGNGRVIATYGDRESTDTELCGFASDLL